MKNLKFINLFIIGFFFFNSCSDDDSLTYIAEPNGEFAFSNSFLPQYGLTSAAATNLGERFTWNSANFGVQTAINYELQRSFTADFSEMDLVATTTNNEIAITIGNLLTYANELGLDNDPATANPDTGLVYFRLKASIGSGDDTDDTTMYSASQAITLFLPETSGGNDPICEFDQLWGVGAGLPDAGWGWTTPVRFACIGDGIYGANVNLQNLGGAEPNNNFRFFTAEGDWASGQNYPFFEDADYTIDSNFENAMDGDSNFAFVGTTGFYYLEINTADMTITLDSPQPTGECEFDRLFGVGAGLPAAGWGWTTPVEIICSGDGVYSASVQLQNLGGAEPNNNFRFFTTEGDWASGRNYPWYSDAGYTIDANLVNAMDGDSNFSFIGTSGTYMLTIDDNNLTITLE